MAFNFKQLGGNVERSLKPVLTEEEKALALQAERGIVPYEPEVTLPMKDVGSNIEKGLSTEVNPSMSQSEIMDNINSGDPTKLQTMLDYINGNKGKIGAAIGGAGLVGYGLSKTGNEPQLQSTVPVVKPKEDKIETPEAVVAPNAVKSAVSKTTSKPKDNTSENQTVEDKTEEIKEPGKSIDFGTGNVANQSNLQATQDQANRMRNIALMGPAFENIAAGTSGIVNQGRFIPKTIGDKFYENMGKQADQGMIDYKAKIEMEKLDPNSSYSKGLKNFIKKSYGYDITGDVSAKDLEEGVMKPLEKQWEQKLLDDRQREIKEQQFEMMRENSKDRNAALAEGRADRQQRHDDTLDARKEAITTKRLDTLNGKLVASMANSRSAFGNAARNAQSVENAKALLDGQLDYNNLDNRQVFELSRVIDKVLSGGVASQYATKHLTPETARAYLADKMEFITNKRQGAGAASFVKTSADLLDREGQLAKKQIADSQSEVLGGMQDLKDNPRFAEILESKGLDPQMFSDENKALKKAKMMEKQQVPMQKVQSPTSNIIKIRRKSDGKVQSLSSDAAQKYMNDSGFEVIP